MTDQLVITRLLPAAPERVFAACTRPELLAQWLTCVEDGEATATAEPRVGGPFRIEMRRRGEAEVVGYAEGEYIELLPPHRLVFTWRADHVGVATSIVTIELRAIGADRTELRLTHSIDPLSLAGVRHARGWATSLTNLHRTLDERK